MRTSVQNITEGVVEIDTYDKITGRVLSERNIKTSSIFILDDSIKYVVDGALNREYKPALFAYFIQPGDSIYKFSGTDTIIISRNGTRYYWVLNKRLE